MPEATVVSFNPERGYGFAVDEVGVSWFVHVTDNDGEYLEVGTVVVFEADTRRRARRIRVKGTTPPVRGTIARLNRERSFGFVHDDVGTYYFFLRTAAADFDQLEEGTQVTFVPLPGRDGRGLKAGAVRRLE